MTNSINRKAVPIAAEAAAGSVPTIMAELGVKSIYTLSNAGKPPSQHKGGAVTNSIDWQAVPIAPEDIAVPLAKIMAELAIKSRNTVYERSKAGKMPPLYNDGRCTFCWRSHLDLYKTSLKPIYASQ